MSLSKETLVELAIEPAEKAARKLLDEIQKIKRAARAGNLSQALEHQREAMCGASFLDQIYLPNIGRAIDG